MFSKSGITELHNATHESVDILLEHVATVPQLVHILTVEEGWVHDLQSKPFDGWFEEDCPTIDALRSAKERIRMETRAYIAGLSEAQLNTTLRDRPEGWSGDLRSPAFILLHVITHTFHHKGQVVAMLRTLGQPAPDTDLQRG